MTDKKSFSQIKMTVPPTDPEHLVRLEELDKLDEVKLDKDGLLVKDGDLELTETAEGVEISIPEFPTKPLRLAPQELIQALDQFQTYAITGFVNGRFVAMGTNRAYHSPDGIAWNLNVTTGLSSQGQANLLYNGERYVAKQNNGQYIVSTNLLSWETFRFPDDLVISEIIFINGHFVGVGRNGGVIGSNGLDDWELTSLTDGEWTSVEYSPELDFYVAVARTGTNRIAYSSDGINWTCIPAPQNNQWYSVTYGNGMFVAVASTGDNRVMYSTDGINWELVTVPLTTWQRVKFGGGLFLAVPSEDTNRVMYSTDGKTWVEETTPLGGSSNWPAAIHYCFDKFLIFSAQGSPKYRTAKIIPAERPVFGRSGDEWVQIPESTTPSAPVDLTEVNTELARLEAEKLDKSEVPDFENLIEEKVLEHSPGMPLYKYDFVVTCSGGGQYGSDYFKFSFSIFSKEKLFSIPASNQIPYDFIKTALEAVDAVHIEKSVPAAGHYRHLQNLGTIPDFAGSIYAVYCDDSVIVKIARHDNNSAEERAVDFTSGSYYATETYLPVGLAPGTGSVDENAVKAIVDSSLDTRVTLYPLEVSDMTVYQSFKDMVTNLVVNDKKRNRFHLIEGSDSVFQSWGDVPYDGWRDERAILTIDILDHSSHGVEGLVTYIPCTEAEQHVWVRTLHHGDWSTDWKDISEGGKLDPDVAKVYYESLTATIVPISFLNSGDYVIALEMHTDFGDPHHGHITFNDHVVEYQPYGGVIVMSGPNGTQIRTFGDVYTRYVTVNDYFVEASGDWNEVFHAVVGDPAGTLIRWDCRELVKKLREIEQAQGGFGYIKPDDGIPKADLSQEVQSMLSEWEFIPL